VPVAVGRTDTGLVNKWLRNIKEVYEKHPVELEAITGEKARSSYLVELNVEVQVRSLAKTSIVQKAWESRTLQLHGWVYGLETSKIKDLQVVLHEFEDSEPPFRYDNL